MIGLYVLLIALFHIPAVQQLIGSQVAAVVSDKLGTKVEVGRVNLGFLNRIIIDDLLIYDQQQQPLLKTSRVSVRIELLPLTEGRISISTAQIFGAHITLYKEHLDSQPNYQFVLDSLASKDSGESSPLDLRINSFIMRQSSISYDVIDQPRTPRLLNTDHLNISDISAHIVLKALRDDSLNVNIKRLSFREQSGLAVEKLALRLEAGKTQAELDDLNLLMPQSDINIPHSTAHYTIKNGAIDMESFQYEGSITRSTVTLADLEGLMPSLRSFPNRLQLESDFNGSSHALQINKLSMISASNDINIEANGWIKDWNQAATWRLNLDHLNLSAKALNFAYQTLSNTTGNSNDIIIRLGNVRLYGEASGQGKAVKANGVLTSDAGTLDLVFDMNQQQNFTGHLQTQDLQLDQLLNNAHFGRTTFNVDLQGQLGNTAPVVHARGNIAQFEYNSYPYQHIQIDGSYQANDINGRLSIEDPNATLTAEGSVMTARHKSDIQLTAHIEKLHPSAVHLTDQWGNSIFGADIHANFTASNINDAQGELLISNFTMRQPNDYFRIDELAITSNYNEDEEHYITIESDFGDMMITGNFDYETLPQSIINIVGSKLPTLPGWPPVTQGIYNDFAFSLHMQNTDFLEKMFNIPFKIRKPLSLNGFFNDRSRTVSINGWTADFEYNGSDYQQGFVEIYTPADSLRLDLSFAKKMDNGEFMTINLKANAIDNHLESSFHLDNNQSDPYSRLSGTINTSSQFYRSDVTGEETAAISILPSEFTLKGTRWHVDPANIAYSKEDLAIDHFSISHGDQHININGHATNLASDTITVDLHDVDLEYVLDLVNFHSVDFRGQVSGRAHAASIFSSNPVAYGKITVDNFKFEMGRMGQLRADVAWNKELEQIDINAVADDGPDAQTYIEGYIAPGPGPGYIDLGIRAEGTHIDFAQNFTNSFCSRVEGQGSGYVNLFGPLNNINLQGGIVANGEVDIIQLGTTYYLRNDSVRFIPDEIEFPGDTIYDKFGGAAVVCGALHHQHLTRMTFDLDIDAQNFLVYDFKDFGEEIYYGTILGTGHVDITGRPGRITFDIFATPEKESVLVYNVSNPDAISQQDFITWNDATPDTLQTTPTPLIPLMKKPSTDMHLNFLVNCTTDATIKLLMDARTNDYITLNGEGVIRASYYNKGGMNMFGTYTVRRGTYDMTIQELIKKDFIFTDGGTISFGGAPFDANLNLQASYMVNGVSLSDLNVGNSFSSNTVRVNCLMNIGGQARAPQVEFDFDMPTVNADEKQMVRSVINGQQEMNQQVLYLLGIGRFYPQTDNNASAQNQSQQSQTSLAMQSLLSGTISGQINSLLGQVVKSNNWTFGANISTGDEGWRNAEYEGLLSGRLLSGRLLIDGQFGYRDNATTATTSFIGDFDVRYLLTPNGSLAIKMYNQTNDRYFTRSSLNTQGLGIILKHDFNSFSELFGKKKKKKKK